MGRQQMLRASLLVVHSLSRYQESPPKLITLVYAIILNLTWEPRHFLPAIQRCRALSGDLSFISLNENRLSQQSSRR
jgi:hypothetical protein